MSNVSRRVGARSRRLYGAIRGVSIAFLVALVCLATRLVFRYSYLLLWVLLAGVLLGALAPGRVVRERSAWRTIREAFVWFFAMLHVAIVVAWLWFATDLFGFVINSRFEALVKDADRVVVRKERGGCHPSSDSGSQHLEITNKVEIAEVAAILKYTRLTLQCKCCGYPCVDWWRDGRRIVEASIHHGHALRVQGFTGDMRFTVESSHRLDSWLHEHCGDSPKMIDR